MKKCLSFLLLLLAFALAAAAQDNVWERVKEVNFPEKELTARWSRVHRSPLLTEDLLSNGTVTLRMPDYLRWETLSPVERVTEMDGQDAASSRFRLPQEKDFSIAVLEGEQYIVQLTPLRRDLKRMVGQIALTVDKSSFQLLYVVILGPDGDWTRIDFSHVVKH